MNYIESYLLSIVTKCPLGLDCLFGDGALLELYIRNTTVVIHDDCFRAVALIGRFTIQLRNGDWSG